MNCVACLQNCVIQEVVDDGFRWCVYTYQLTTTMFRWWWYLFPFRHLQQKWFICPRNKNPNNSNTKYTNTIALSTVLKEIIELNAFVQTLVNRWSSVSHEINASERQRLRKYSCFVGFLWYWPERLSIAANVYNFYSDPNNVIKWSNYLTRFIWPESQPMNYTFSNWRPIN